MTEIQPHRHIDVPPEIILEILALCPWEAQISFRRVCRIWHSYVTTGLRRTRYHKVRFAPGQPLRGAHKLFTHLTLSYLWNRPVDEVKIVRKSDGGWWKQETGDWLTETIFWREACTEPPM